MEMYNARETAQGNTAAPQVASISPPRRIPQRVRESLDRHAKQVGRARQTGVSFDARSGKSRAGEHERWLSEAVALSEASEARVPGQRRQRGADPQE